mmetsp:Transcript_13015/g.16182  ORF Transcript_13015/g.16182 Transcript_13015/m.16182 type:complete len:110 (-) Transcript_13015:1288-1617(-)
MDFPSACIALGFLLMFHAAFSTVHYKGLAQLAGSSSHDHLIPFDVKVEVLVSIVVTLFGTLTKASRFVPFSGSESLGESSWSANVSESKSFRIFNHRNKFLKQRLAKKK